MWICTTGDHKLDSTALFTFLNVQPLWGGGDHNVKCKILNIQCEMLKLKFFSHFGEEGITMLTKCYYKFDGGVLKTLNLRMCKLTEKVLFCLLVDIFFTRIY